MDLLIFDLDGTLIDSKLDLAHSVNAALEGMGRDRLPNELIETYVGNGAPVLMRRALGENASEEEVKLALDFFLAYYREHMLDNTYLYAGVREALDHYHEAGKQMAVLTNKPVRFSRDLVKGLGLGDHFFQVYGGNSFEEKKPHPIGIHTLIKEADVDKEKALMIGDSSVDVETARNAGIEVCGVTWGFAPESLKDTAPDYLIDTMEELTRKVISNCRTAP